jgi:teichuronic acid biosynthesis glycosyltransferase TuaC
MRICRVTIGYPPRRCGWSHHAYYLSKYQAMLGHKVLVFQPHHQEETSLATEDQRVYQVALGPLGPYWGSKVARMIFAGLTGTWILRLSRTHHFDVIHGHGDVFEAFPLRVAARFLRIPLVMTVHSCLNNARRYRIPASGLWTAVDRIIAVSQKVKQDLQAVGYPAGRIDVISSGVETSLFAQPTPQEKIAARHELGVDPVAFIVVAIGRLHPMKGFNYLIPAVKSLMVQHKMYCYVLGDGQQRQSLECSIGTDQRIFFVGSVPHEQISKWLHAADLFVLPSVDLSGQAEGTPTAVMEAMATGLPVVTTDSGGAKDLIATVDGCNVVPQRDSRALARAILELIENVELRQRLGQLNWQRSQERDWSRIAAAVGEVYKKAGVAAA